MKYTLITLLCTLLSIAHVLGQKKIDFRAVGGVSIATLKVKASSLSIISSSVTGFGAGVDGIIPLCSKVDFCPGIHFVQEGGKFENFDFVAAGYPTSQAPAYFILSYLHIPLSFEIKPTEKIYFFGGPGADFVMIGKLKDKTKKVLANSTEGMKKFVPTLHAGMGYNLTNNISLRINYNMGLTSIEESSSGSSSMGKRYFFAGIAYKF